VLKEESAVHIQVYIGKVNVPHATLLTLQNIITGLGN